MRASRQGRSVATRTEREVCPTCGHATPTVIADTPIARAIFVRRRADGLTLRQAATAVGVSTSTVWRVERGKMPDVESAVKLAAWLGQSLDALFLPRADAASQRAEASEASSPTPSNDSPGAAARRGAP